MILWFSGKSYRICHTSEDSKCYKYSYNNVIELHVVGIRETFASFFPTDLPLFAITQAINKYTVTALLNILCSCSDKLEQVQTNNSTSSIVCGTSVCNVVTLTWFFHTTFSY